MVDKTEDTALFIKRYLEDLLSFFGLKVDVEVNIEDDTIFLDVPSTHLNGFLIGSRSETLRAIHTLLVSVVKQYNQQFVRINLDIANYKKNRDRRLLSQAKNWIKKVKQTGKNMSLEPMNAADRRLVHHLANDSGLNTESVGEGSARHIILKRRESVEPEPEEVQA